MLGGQICLKLNYLGLIANKITPHLCAMPTTLPTVNCRVEILLELFCFPPSFINTTVFKELVIDHVSFYEIVHELLKVAIIKWKDAIHKGFHEDSKNTQVNCGV